MKQRLLLLISQHELLIFFGLVFVATWLHSAPQVAYALGWLAAPPSARLMLGLQVIGLFGGPIGAAAMIAALTGGTRGLRAWFAPVFRWRVGWRWYLIVLLAYPLLAIAAIVATDLIRGTGSHVAVYFNGRVAEMAAGLGLTGAARWLLIPILLLYGLIVVPLYEEPGWRGFALPRLQARHSALTSSVVLGAIWAVWHLPNFFIPGSPHYGMPFVGFLLGITAMSVLMTWVYNNTGGSVWMSMLWHGSVIVGSIFFPAGIPGVTGDLLAYWLSTAIGVIAAAAVVLVAGPRQLTGRRAMTGLPA